MVGLHSSDPASVYLSAWARVDGFAPADLEDALYHRRSLVRMLGMRRTLFVVPVDLAAVMHEACTKARAPAERRRLVRMLEEQGVASAGRGERWLERVASATLEALRARGEASARELTADVPELGRKLDFGQGTTWAATVGVSTRVLFLLATEGLVVRARPLGSWTSGQYRWATTEHWLGGPLPEIDHAEACAELLGRWLRTFGPATTTDLRWWTGWTAKLSTRTLEAVGAVEVALGDGAGHLAPDDLDPEGDVDPWVALVPGLDPTVMGWKDRGGTSATMPPTCSTPTGTPARRCGRTARWSERGGRPSEARWWSSCSAGWTPRPASSWTLNVTASGAGSATFGSGRGSRRLSARSWQRDRAVERPGGLSDLASPPGSEVVRPRGSRTPGRDARPPRPARRSRSRAPTPRSFSR